VLSNVLASVGCHCTELAVRPVVCLFVCLFVWVCVVDHSKTSVSMLELVPADVGVLGEPSGVDMLGLAPLT
jgi:hypothetical protein